MGWIPVKFRNIWPYKTSETLILIIFSIVGGPRKVDDLGTSPNNQFWDHFTRNRIEWLVELCTTNFKNRNNNRPNCFQSLTFCRNLGFQKPGICPRHPPGGFTFPEMTPTKETCSGKWQTHQKSSFDAKMTFFFMPFFEPHVPTPPDIVKGRLVPA